MYTESLVLWLIIAFRVRECRAFLALRPHRYQFRRASRAAPAIPYATRKRDNSMACMQNLQHLIFDCSAKDISFASAYIRASKAKRLQQQGPLFMSEAASATDTHTELDKYAVVVNSCLESVRQLKLNQNTVRQLQSFSERLDISCGSLHGQSIDRLWAFFEVGLDVLLKDPELTAMQHWLLGRAHRSLGRALVASQGPDVAGAVALIDEVSERLVQYIDSRYRWSKMELSTERANMLVACCIRMLLEIQESLDARFPLIGLDTDAAIADASRKIFRAMEAACSDFSEDEVGDTYRAFLEHNIMAIIENMDPSMLQNSSRSVTNDYAREASYFGPIWRPTESMIDFLKFIDVIPLEGAFGPLDEIPGIDALERHFYLLDPSNSVRNAWIKMLSRKVRRECNLCVLENAPLDVDDASSSADLLASSRALFDYGRTLASAELCGWHLYSSYDNEEMEELWYERPQNGIDLIQEFGSKGKDVSPESLMAVMGNASAVLKETDMTVRPLWFLNPHASSLDATLQFIPHSMRLRIKSTFEALYQNFSEVGEGLVNRSSNVSSSLWMDNVGAVSMAVRLSAAAKGRAALLCNASDTESEEGLPGSTDAAFLSAFGRVLSDHLCKTTFSERDLTNDLISASALIEFMAIEEPEEAIRSAVKVALLSAVLKCSTEEDASTAFATLGQRIAILRPLITRCLLFESGSDVFNAQDSWFNAEIEAAVADSAIAIIEKTAASNRNVSKPRKIVLATDNFGSAQGGRRRGPILEGIRRFISLKGLMGGALGIDTTDAEGDTAEDVERQVGEAYFASVASKALIQGIEDLPGMNSQALGLYFKELAEACGLNEMDASSALMHLASLAASQVIIAHLSSDSVASMDGLPPNDQYPAARDDMAARGGSEAMERLRALQHMFNMYQVPRPLFSGFGSEPDSYIGGCAKLCVDYISANLQGDGDDTEEQAGPWDKMATLARNIEIVIDLLNLTKGPKNEEFALFLNLLKTGFTNLYITQGDTALLESFSNEFRYDESASQERDPASQRNG